MQDEYIRKATIINVVDGDTVDAIVDLGYHMTTKQRFRLLGVDTPEKNEIGWHEATEHTKSRLLNQSVTIQSTKSDSFGRFLATIYLDGQQESYNQELLDQCLAKVYHR